MTEIGNYTIIHQLGEGGMATVYLAEHKTLGHKVAIKVLAKEFLYNKGIKDRFIDEAKKMVRMNHPNVVKVTDLINDGDSVAIVMEYVDGETLRDLLSKKKLTDNEIENYLKQMVSALDYVHKQGLVHRDIKPSNFIFNSEGILKLADFGISKNLSGELNERTQTGTAMSMGTPMYMSPEQVRSTKDVTYLSDIYSLGVVLWEMATGKKPYDLATLSAFDLLTKVVNDPLPLTNNKWDWFIQKATQKNERDRYNDVEEIEFHIENPSRIKVNSDVDKTIITEIQMPPISQPKVRYSLLFILTLIIIVFVGVFAIYSSSSVVEKSSSNDRLLNNKIPISADSTNDPKGEIIQNVTFKYDIKEKFKEWELYLIENHIFDYVSEKDCKNEKKMNDLHEKDYYPMHSEYQSYLKCQLNNDGIDDYIIQYELDNCVQGNGYTNDFIIVKSVENGYVFDRSSTEKIKEGLLNYVKENFIMDSYVSRNSGYLNTKGLEIKKADQYEVYGSFKLQGNAPACCSEYEGRFSFNFKKNTFLVHSLKKEIQ